MKFKIIVNYVTFIILLIIVATFVSKLIYRNTSYYEAGLLKTIYNIEPNTVDVLVVGPSTSETGWNSFVAWNEYGITSLNYSFSYLPAPIIKNLIIDVLKKQKPKVILINVDSLLFDNLSNDKSQKFFFYHIFPKIPFSLNKLSMLQRLTKYYSLNPKTFIYSVFPVTAIDKIALNDTENNSLSLGYFRAAYFKRNSSLSFIHSQKIRLYETEKPVPQEYIEELIDFCNSLDTPTMFMSVPAAIMFTKPFGTIGVKNRYNPFFSHLNKRRINFIHSNQYRTVRDLKLKNGDSFDEDHLNFWGSQKFTRYVSDILVKNFKLKDKRNNPKYAFWNDAAKEYVKDVKKVFGVDISL